MTHLSSTPQPVVLSWSGGKDSALALHTLRQSEAYDVVALLTTVSEEYQRISHHGVRVALLEQQAEAVGVPLHKLSLPSGDAGPCTNEQYEGVMRQAMLEYRERGITHVAFGDLLLEDLRRYREGKLEQVAMSAVFPLWMRDTAQLAREFIELGFESYLSCVDGRKLDETFVGRRYDHALLRDLPVDVDPCGENGEFHSFVCDGPIFRQRVPITIGQRVKRDDRYFIEMMPEGAEV